MTVLAESSPPPPRPVRQPPDPRTAAAAAGIDGAAQGRLTDLSRSHLVHHLDARGGSVVVKRLGDSARAAGRGLDGEMFVYRLATWRPGLAEVVPRALLVDERRGVLVLEASPLDQLGTAALPSGRLPDREVAAALGRALAAVHTATRGVPVPARASHGVLHLPDAEASVLGLHRARDLVSTVRHDRLLCDVLRRAARSWTPSCLVHGDVKWDNCLVDRGSAPPVVRLIDWEMSGWGDPAWDVAAALAQGSALEPAGDRAEEVQAALVAGYVSAADGDVVTRTAGYWPARVVHLALECAEAGADDAADRLLETARALAEAEEDLAARVASWSR